MTTTIRCRNGQTVVLVTARLRPDVFESLSDMPRAELARSLGVSVSALRSYVTGRTMPGQHTIRRLADLTGRPNMDIVELDPPAEPCPSWCDAHDLSLVPSRDAPRGTLEVLGSHHRTLGSRRNDLAASVHELSDGRVYVHASNDGVWANRELSVSIVGLDVDDVRWLAAELVRLAHHMTPTAPPDPATVRPNVYVA